jgi:LacI family transcriptional regulator
MAHKAHINTIRDVAETAGVSITTVSHVINKTRFVSEDLVQRVNEAIRELNYQPSGLARSLRTRASGTIGIVIPDNTNPFFAEVVRGIEDYCYEQGYSVFLCNSDGAPDREYNHLKMLREKGVEGLILVSAGDDQDSLELLGSGQIPNVIIDREVEISTTDAVLVDNFKGGYEATQYLIQLGHRRIGCITGPSQITPSGQRLKGYIQALLNNTLEVDENLIITGNFRSQSGSAGLLQLMKATSPPTAIFACNDLMAIGAMAAAREIGINIPEQVSIIGFDDIALASLVIPKLTTIAQPIRTLGETGAKLLLQRIRKETSSKSTIILDPVLVKRESTASTGR